MYYGVKLIDGEIIIREDEKDVLEKEDFVIRSSRKAAERAADNMKQFYYKRLLLEMTDEELDSDQAKGLAGFIIKIRKMPLSPEEFLKNLKTERKKLQTV